MYALCGMCITYVVVYALGSVHMHYALIGVYALYGVCMHYVVLFLCILCALYGFVLFAF